MLFIDLPLPFECFPFNFTEESEAAPPPSVARRIIKYRVVKWFLGGINLAGGVASSLDHLEKGGWLR